MRDKAEVKELIQNKARELFLKNGYKETRIMDISNALHISPATIYMYFKGKKELFNSLDIPEAKNIGPEHEAKREKIIQAALLLFGEKGFDGTTMNMIAKKADLSKASLYQYFDNKDDLFAVVMKETPFHYNFMAIQPDFTKSDIKNVIVSIGKAYLALFDTRERAAFTRTIIRDSNKHPEISNMYHQNGIGYVAKCVENSLKAFKMQIRPEIDLYLASKTYVGSLFSFAIEYKIIVGVDRQFTDEEIVNTSADIFLRGIMKDKYIRKENG